MSGGNRADAVDGRNEIDRHLFVCYLLFFMIASYAAVGAACLVPAAVLVFLRFLDPVRLLEKIYPSRHSVMLQQVLIIGLLVIAVYLSVPGRAAGGGRRWAAEISPWAVIWASALSLAIGRRRRMLFMPAVGLAALFLVNGTKSGGLSYPILTLSAALTATVCGRALQMSRSPVAARKGHWLAVGLYGGAAVLLLGIPMAMLAFIVFPRLPRNTETGIADGEDARRKGIFRNFGGTRTGILPAPDLRFGHEMLLSERPAFSVKFLDSEGQPPNAESIYWRADAISRYAHGRWIEDTGWKMVYDRSDGVPDNLVRLSMEPAGVLIPHTLHADRGHFFDCIPGVYPMFAVAVPAINPRVEVNGEGAVRPYRHDPFDIGVLSRRTVQFWDMAQGAVAAHPDPKYTEKNGIPERLAAKAKEVAGSQAGAYGKITSLKNELFATCRYSFRYAATPGVDPVEEFVFERRQGSCALFASALTLMLRSVDVPARLALGYKGGVPHRQEEHALVVRECDAHAWVEVHFEGHGWLPVEATPSTTAAAFVDATHDLDEARPGLYDRAYTWWAREVVGYSSRKQRQVMLGLRTRMTGIYRKVRMLVDEHGWGIVVAAAALAAAVVLAKMIAGIRRRRRLEGLPEMRGPFYNLLRHLSRLGMKRRLGETPREYAVTLARAAVDLPDIDRAVHLFYAWRYGERDTLEALDAEVTSIIARLPGRIYGIMQRETSEGRAGSDES